MAGQISNIRRQLKSVRSTQKITNAMSLVATAKLQKQRGKMAENDVYMQRYLELLLTALSSEELDESANMYFQKRDFHNPLHIVITSNSGLCGSYNMDLLKYVEKNISKDEAIFAIGTYGIKWLDSNDFMVIKRFTDLDNLNPRVMEMLIYDILELYKHNEISSIDIVYTQYVNTLTFEPSTYQLLPISLSVPMEKKPIELAPSGEEVLNILIPKYISAVVYDTFLEAKTSEHASRRSAMESANKNAQNLIEEISLSYNQARQATITQEVNEITAGADAI